MNTSTRNSFKIGCIIIGTITGAGFASGQEILQFFTVFRHGGFKGIILAGILFFIVCYSVLNYIFTNKIDGYSQYINIMVGKYGGYAIEVIVMLFLLSGFFIMIAGTGAFFKEFFGIEAIAGASLMAGLCCLVFLFDVKGVVSVNAVLAPILVAGIFLIGIYIGVFADTTAAASQGRKILNDWFSSSMVYVSYNSIILIAILSNLREYIDSKGTILRGVFFGVGTLFAMAMIIYFITSSFFNSAVNSQMPIIRIIKDIQVPAGWIYGVVLLCAMFTSSISSGYCFLNRISDIIPIGYKVNAILICILSLPLSALSFAGMIGWLYPIFGYLGLFQVIIVICGWILSLNRWGKDNLKSV
ncbi:MAG: hypothetical protein ACM3KR_04985 [Deltaproteobacteria bacterium]